MRWKLTLGLAGAALAAGAAAAIRLAPAPAPAEPEFGPGWNTGDDYIVTPLTPIALGHRRALDFLNSDEKLTPLREAAMRASPSVVRVVMRLTRGSAAVTSRGSGVVVGERLVLTARHLLHSSDKQEIRVLLPSGEEVTASIVSKGDGYDPFARRYSGDWLVLEVARDAPSLPPPLDLASAGTGTEVVTIGFGGDVGLGPDGRPMENGEGPSGRPTWAVGRIVDPNSMTLEPLAGSLPVGGVSGGAVVDATGRLVGIVNGVSWETDSAQGVPPTRNYRVNVASVAGASSLLTSTDRRTR